MMLQRITILLTLIGAWNVCLAQSSIGRYRYWLNSDAPTTVAHTGGAVALEPDISAQQPGMHFLYFQAQNVAGKWGKLHKYMYYVAKADSVVAPGTQVKRGEYWIDDNYYSRDSLTLDKQGNVGVALNVDLSGLAEGVHYFRSRFQNERGEWGGTISKIFLYAPVKTEEDLPARLTRYEMWLDSDVEGTKKSGTLTGSALEVDYDLSTASEGCHFLYFRAQNNRGHWGKLHKYMYYVARPDSTELAASRVAVGEHWIDDNYSARTLLDINQEGNAGVALNIDVSKLTTGIHYFRSRFQNERGEWGGTISKVFLYAPQETIEVAPVESYEMWLDDDYEGTKRTGTMSGSTVAVDYDLNATSEGCHFLYFRARNTRGEWGKLHKYMFYNAPDVKTEVASTTLGACEYWFNNDYAQRITAQANTAEVLSIDVSHLKRGLHYFNYRAQNGKGEWGAPVRKFFYVLDKYAVKGAPITAYRYTINEQTMTKKITATTSYVKDLALSMPKNFLGWATVDDSCRFSFDATANTVKLRRDVKCLFAMQFQNQGGNWSAPIDTTFMMPDSVTYDIDDLKMNGSLKYTKLKRGDYRAFKFSFDKAGTYYLRATQECRLMIFEADSCQRIANLESYELKDTYAAELDSGTYYGVLYNTVTDEDNADANITVRLMLTPDAAVPDPVITYDKGTVSIACELTEAKIYYTTDGTDPQTSGSRQLYTQPFVVDGNAVIKAVAEYEGYNPSAVVKYTIDGLIVYRPMIQYLNGQITITCETENATIWYTTDGTDPQTSATRQQYAEPFTITGNRVVKAMAERKGYQPSAVAELVISSYVVTPPTITLDGYEVTMTGATAGATIWYTTDDTDPQTSSTRKTYVAPFTIPGNTVIRYYATLAGYTQSEVMTYSIVHFKVALPVIEDTDGAIAIRCETPNATIWYTTDGSDPLTSATRSVYITPFEVKGDMLIKAAATLNYHKDSDVAQYVRSGYTVKAPVVTFNTASKMVTIHSETKQAEIWYTTDGSDPLSSSTKQQYVAPFLITNNCVIKAVAQRKGYVVSSVTTYSVESFKVATPVINDEESTISINCSTPNAVVWYTTDGSDPIASATREMYVVPFDVEGDMVIKAVAMLNNYKDSDVAQYVRKGYTVANPVVNFNADVQLVTIQSTTTNAEIWYTLDGSDPVTSTTRKQYTTAFMVEKNTTIKTVAMRKGYVKSEVVTYMVESFKVATPVIRDVNGLISIHCETPNSVVWYTMDGSDPSTSFTREMYVAPFEVVGDMVIKAMAVLDDYKDSDVAQYVRSGYTVAKPVITFNRINYSVTIKSETAQANIWYTLDGSDPLTSATRKQYTTSFEQKNNAIIKAVGMRKGFVNSGVAELIIDDLRVETPTVSYENNVLTIQCGTAGATIYYEIGNAVNPATSAVYDGPITLIDNRTVSIVATMDGFETSEVTQFTPTNFICEPVTMSYDGRMVSMVTPTTGAVIRYTTDGTEPNETSAEYRDPVVLDGLCTVKAVVTKGYTKNSSTITYEVPTYYNEGKTYVAQAGQLTKAYEWCDIKAVKRMHLVGTINATDLSTIKSLSALQHLEMSEVAIDNEQLPDEAFAGMNLVSLATPLKIQQAGRNLLKGVKTIGAIEWNANIAVPTDILGGAKHPNMLLYVKSSAYADSKQFRNLVVNDYAQNIVLSDEAENGNFYCSRPFTAGRIRYSHVYSQETQIGVCRGWEAIALPFDVESIEHTKQGALAPFAQEDNEKKPFWLYDLNGHFTTASRLEANTPYIISMPNSDDYAEDYILGGEVAFSAENARVPHSGEVVTGEQGYFRFVPNYQHLAATDSLMTLNIDETYDQYEQGSVFVANHRAAKPFEAYITSDRKLTKGMTFAVEEGVSNIEDLTALRSRDVYSEHGVLYIYSRTNCNMNLYSVDGRLIKVLHLHGGLNEIRDLIEGVYVVKGMKIIVK